jgi:hypothetical protein
MREGNAVVQSNEIRVKLVERHARAKESPSDPFQICSCTGWASWGVGRRSEEGEKIIHEAFDYAIAEYFFEFGILVLAMFEHEDFHAPENGLFMCHCEFGQRERAENILGDLREEE